jgi:hypothetical protein
MPDPDWTRTCLVSDLNELQDGQPYMLRTSDEPTSPWRSVKTRNQGWWKDQDTGTVVTYITVEFHDDDAERLLNRDDEIEVGLIRPPYWPEDLEPPEWPRR